MTTIEETKAQIDAEAAWTHPGKFEGCSALGVYLYGRMMDGDGDIETDCAGPCECCDDDDMQECDCPVVALFDVDDDEARVFECQPGRYWLAESEYGFVSMGREKPQ